MEKKLRTLSFRKSLLVEGGAERFMVEVIDHLSKAGADARGVALNGKPADKFFDGKYSSLNIVRFSNGEYPGGLFLKILRSLWAIFKLRGVIRKFNPDFICGQNTADAEILFFATMGMKRKYSFFMPSTMFRFPDDDLKYTTRFRSAFHKAWDIIPGHRVFIPESKPSRGILRRLINELRAVIQYRAVRKAEHMLVLTKQMGFESQVLYNRGYTMLKAGLSEDIFEYKQKQDMKAKLGIKGKMILNINRLDVRKRIDISIEAFKDVLKDFPDAHFVIGGRGAERENLETLVAKLAIADKVTFLGFVPEEDLYDYFTSCDLFIHLDWADFDLAVLEGLALDKKVVTSSEFESEGSISQLNDSRLFRAYPDVEEVSKTMVTALRSKAEPLAKPAVALAEYTWESYAKNLLKIIRNGG